MKTLMLALVVLSSANAADRWHWFMETEIGADSARSDSVSLAQFVCADTAHWGVTGRLFLNSPSGPHHLELKTGPNLHVGTTDLQLRFGGTTDGAWAAGGMAVFNRAAVYVIDPKVWGDHYTIFQKATVQLRQANLRVDSLLYNGRSVMLRTGVEFPICDHVLLTPWHDWESHATGGYLTARF